MGNQDIKDYVVWNFLELIGDFLILFAVVLLCEWYAMRKGYNSIDRAWLITVGVLMVLILDCEERMGSI
ncbi:hypothetical protein FS935_22720 [Metabacillus litoralis]|uniref:Uncharacterized protein n=1 Tax=Metabacillus litoralis TaxID=152268 RepID=A0A5C6UYL1_9BACI|nr:hypothetical protein [Metabacillus litoralis]TXC78502.1 hypothetical protein FS935_22720 [Metabacillus litoralis]